MKIRNRNMQNTGTPHPKLPRRLIVANIAAFLLWLLSLPMNVFLEYEGTEVLVLGTLFGWMLGEAGYWAVYANYFALCLMLPLRFSTRVSMVLLVCMWLLALLTFTLDKAIINGAGHHEEIHSYGAGLYLWFTALCVLSAGRLAVLRQKNRQAV